MKINEIRELRQKSDAELTTLLAEARARMRSLQFDLAQGKVKNVGELRSVRKLIARLLTFLGARTPNAS